jgi:hypothetical protein
LDNWKNALNDVETHREFCWNFVVELGGGGEDAHDRKERTTARSEKLLPFMEGGQGSREGRKKLFDPISLF